MIKKIMNKILKGDFDEKAYKAAVNELQFEKMQVRLLVEALDEILYIAEEGLTRDIIWNTLDRHELNKNIHAKKLFDQYENHH